MGIRMMPDDGAKPGWMRMHWSAKGMNESKFAYYERHDSINQGALNDRCMDCETIIDPGSTVREKRRFSMFDCGYLGCHQCVPQYAMANLKWGRWEAHGAKHDRSIMSWLETSTFTSVTFMDDDGDVRTVHLDPKIEFHLWIRVFVWDDAVRGWVDEHDNERMPPRYESLIRKWMDDEMASQMSDDADNPRKSGDLPGHVRRLRVQRKFNPKGRGVELDARKLGGQVAPRRINL